MYIYIYLNMASDCICSRNEDSYMSYTTIYNLQYFLYRVATHRQVQVWLRLNTPKLSALMNVISRLILTKLAIISYWIGTSLTQLGTGLKDKKKLNETLFCLGFTTKPSLNFRFSHFETYIFIKYSNTLQGGHGSFWLSSEG